MKTPWACRTRRSDAPRAAALRLRRDVRALEDGESLWLRGDDIDDDLDLELRALPDAERFEILDGGRLRPCGKLLPTTRLPEGDWEPLGRRLAPSLAPAALCGHAVKRVALTLVRSSAERPANVLVTDLASWTRWASSAPRVRLARLRFAISEVDRVVVAGTPLPPLPGRRLVEDRGIAVPCGLGWEPAVDAGVVLHLIGVDGREGNEDLALFREDASHELVPGPALVAASRGAVRLSLAELRRA